MGVAVQIRSGFDFIGNPKDFYHNSPLKQIPVFTTEDHVITRAMAGGTKGEASRPKARSSRTMLEEMAGSSPRR